MPDCSTSRYTPQRLLQSLQLRRDNDDIPHCEREAVRRGQLASPAALFHNTRIWPMSKGEVVGASVALVAAITRLSPQQVRLGWTMSVLGGGSCRCHAFRFTPAGATQRRTGRRSPCWPKRRPTAPRWPAAGGCNAGPALDRRGTAGAATFAPPWGNPCCPCVLSAEERARSGAIRLSRSVRRTR